MPKWLTLGIPMSVSKRSRLDVPMDDARVVRNRERGEHAHEIRPRPGIERTERDLVSQGATGKSFHHEKRAAVVLAAVVHRDNVGG